MLDGLDEEDRHGDAGRWCRRSPGFVVVYGFARRYRRKKILLWGDGPASRIPSLSLAVDCGTSREDPDGRPQGSVEALVDASPEQVWAVLADVTRDRRSGATSAGRRSGCGGWTREPGGGRGSAGATARASCAGAAPARSRSRSRRAASRTAPVAAGSATAPSGPSTSTPAGTGTRVVQSFRVLSLPRWAEVVICLLVPGHQDRAEALTADLERLGRVAGAEVRSR